MLVSPLLTTSLIRTILPPRFPAPSVARYTANFSAIRKFHLSASTSQEGMYWNRETSKPTTSFDDEVIREARIIALSDPNDTYNQPLYDGPLPDGSKLLAVGASFADFDKEEIITQNPNVIFVSHPNSRGPLVELLQKFPSVEWVHTRSAGIDFIASEGK